MLPFRSPDRRLAAAVLAMVLALVLASCGSASEDSGSDAGGESSGAFPVTVEHKYGKTEIESEPKKIVTLGLSDQDAVLALGKKPVGAVDWFKEKPFGKWTWTKDKWGKDLPEIVGERDNYKVEKIAKLDPDLILAQYSGMKKEQYEKLSKIAPVVAQPKGHEDYLAPWQVMTEQIGKSLGKQDETKKLISDIDGKFKAVADKHPEWSKETIAVADSFEAGKYAAFTKGDAKAAFFKDLGFKLSDDIEKKASKGQNAAEFSSENLDLLDVDRLVWVTMPEAPKRIKAEPLYKKLNVAKDKRDLFVPYEDVGAAFSFNTVLSIPYAIDEMEPLLAKDDK